jgi:hypothetical protein
MFTFQPIVLAAAVTGILAAAVFLSVAVVAWLRGGRSRGAARRLAPMTVMPAVAAFFLSSLVIAGTLPAAAPLAGVLLVTAGLVPSARSLWRTSPGRSTSLTTAHTAD